MRKRKRKRTREELEQLARERVLAFMDRQRGCPLTGDEADALAVEVQHEIRRLPPDPLFRAPALGRSRDGHTSEDHDADIYGR